MSTFSGPQSKGAMRAHRETKRREAEQRQARAEARRVVEAYTETKQGEQ